MKRHLIELSEVKPALFHKENALVDPTINYEKPIVNLKMSSQRAIERFKQAKG